MAMRNDTQSILLERPMTLEEALKRDYSTHPLNPEEREAVLDSLGASLIALGCKREELDSMRESIVYEIQRPKSLLYAAERRRQRDRSMWNEQTHRK
jgi:hypothetical protein